MTKTIRVATRGSLLALTQTGWVVDRLREAHPGTEFATEVFKTVGDKILDVALNKIGGKGLFTKELEDALLDGRADIAIHSLKDMPTEQPDGLIIGCVPERVDPRDAVVTADGRPFAELPAGAIIGTSSLRRVAQLMALRPDLSFTPIRGNIDTRLRKLAAGEASALVIAAAGLHRAGFADRITEYLNADVCLPAPGQGALAIELRAADDETARILGAIHHTVTFAAVTAERALLARLEGGCQVPIAAHAEVAGDQLRLKGLVATLDGSQILTWEDEGPVADPVALGNRVAEKLISLGGDTILNAVRG